MQTLSFLDLISNNKYGRFSVAALIIGLLLSIVALFGIKEVSYWQQHGQAIQGTVLNKYTEKNCNSGSSSTGNCTDYHYLTYRYSPSPDKSFEGKDSVNQSFWKQQEKGSEITLLYSAIQPAKNSVSYASGTDTQKTLWMLVFVVGILSMTIGIWFLFRLHRQSVNVSVNR